MTELIDPKALKQYIDDCKVCDNCPDKNMRCYDGCELPDFLTKQWERIIDEQPIIEAEPVIRCKDCKYYKDGDCWHEWDNDGQIYYQSVINEPNPDDYCSKAKRKEE